MKSKFKILSLDGGGLRGIIPLIILQEIEKKTGKPIKDCFDLITGTSTGGIIACGLASGKTVEELLRLYKDHGKEIFVQRNYFNNKYRKTISFFRGANFNNAGLSQTLDKYFKAKKLSDCVPAIQIPTFSLTDNSPLFFRSRNTYVISQNSSEKKDVLLKDICLSTSAGPTFLPPHKFNYVDENLQEKEIICIDGGIYVNNPSIAALAEVVKFHKDPIYDFEFNSDLKNIYILSLGTGTTRYDFNCEDCLKWGMIDWGKNISDVMINASSELSHIYLEDLLTFDLEDGHEQKNYLRIQLKLDDAKLSNLTNSSKEAYEYLIIEANKKIQLETPKIEKFLTDANIH